ncbi:hypothetical protein [Buchananella hordeovulneris]|uniref:hypothetical protein n=1 Tax=Buchananella hordeovulneris TaxID=52770 RepID=UPI000F5F5D42|nr:hypothetical protein [Buchananella hordeovulneris]RRD42692.1 hypothetical protein EII13_08820 [Buchananella hordeovulneris]
MTDNECRRRRNWVAAIAATLICLLGIMPINAKINNLTCQAVLEPFGGGQKRDRSTPLDDDTKKPKPDELNLILAEINTANYCTAARQRRILTIEIILCISATAYLSISCSRLRRAQDEEEGTKDES